MLTGAPYNRPVDETARHLRLLTETIAAVNSTLDLEEVLSLVAREVADALGGIGGRRDKRTAEYARGLAEAGDEPSGELQARVREPLSLALSYGSGLLLVAVLALMIWKPGA